jgi:cytochrome c oxidase subunit I
MNAMQKPLSRWWLLLGTVALAIAGLFSLVLVVARTPQLASLPLFSDLFHKALVVHVDLSVLVWFLAIACLLWSLLTQKARSAIPFLEEAALLCFAGGMLAIALSPLDSHGEALMVNYIPVIYSPAFFVGLALLLCGVLFILTRLLTSPAGEFDKALQFGLYSAGLITVMALAAFAWSYHQMPGEIDGPQYYELAFWGGGHVLQFTHAQVLMVAWLLIMKAVRPDFALPQRWLMALFAIGPLAALTTPLAYLLYDVTSQEHRLFFTYQMIMGNGLAPSLLALLMIPALMRSRQKNALWTATSMSVLLFLYGGLLGGMIEGQNVVIPAHYHGSIVGVTLGFMGLAYLLLPRLGYRDVTGWRLARWQPVVYGIGQIMHISGLAWSGGYGVLRKTPGALEEGLTAAKVTMGIMGLGGLLAIIGGFMFVVVVGRAVCRKAPSRS